MEKYLDLRIIKTREQLYKALFESLQDQTHNLDKIKVLDICSKADVSAITFYKHFKNSSELIESAIKDQIGNRLPIPLKMKPHNLKQLLIYLINFLSQYFKENKLIIINTFIYCSNKGFKDTYLDIFIKILIFYTKQEILLIYKNEENISINIWSEFIIGGLFYLFVNRIIKNRTIENNIILSNINSMNCYFK